VKFKDSQHTFLDSEVEIEQDAAIGVGVQIYGTTHIGKGACIDGPSVIKDALVGADAKIRPFCHLEGAHVKAGAIVGPFARLSLVPKCVNKPRGQFC